MAKFEINKEKLWDMVDKSIMVGTNIYEQKVLENVPRDQNRLPNNINLKSGETPKRNVRKGNKNYYRKPVQINGNWYEGVTGALKRSIGNDKLADAEYIVGVREGPTEEYGFVQEFGSDDGNIPARSFLRKALKDDGKKIISQIQKTFKELVDKT